MSKKKNIILFSIAILLCIWGIIAICRPIAYNEKYNASGYIDEIIFYKSGEARIRSELYQGTNITAEGQYSRDFIIMDTSDDGRMTISIFGDKVKVVNFYKLEMTPDVHYADIEPFTLTCTTKLLRVVAIFVVAGILFFISFCGWYNRRVEDMGSRCSCAKKNDSGNS